MEPPVASKEPTVVEHHGDRRIDEYAWLRDRDDPRVLEHLRAENAYTEAAMAHTEDLQEALYAEILGHIQETDVSAPVRWGDFLYYRRTEEGKDYPIHCRRRGSVDAPEEILLDENVLAEGHDHHEIGVFEVDEDHRLLAYSQDVTGGESYTLRVKDLETGTLLPDEIPGTSYTLAWANDGRSFLYTVHDEAMRPHRLCRHVLGTDPSTDEVVHEEGDDRFYVHVSKTRSRRFVFLEVHSAVTSEVWFADAASVDGFRVIRRRRQGVEYDVEHQGDRFLIRTNADAVNFRLAEVPADEPWREAREVVRGREDVKLEGVDAFRDHVVRYERREGLRRIVVRRVSSGEEHAVEMPEAAYGVWPWGNPAYDTSTLGFAYTSLVTPMSWFTYDMDTRERTLVKRQPVPGYDPSRYVTERIFATAPDGAEVPISLVRRADLELDGADPCWLYGYGSYGMSMDPTFSPTRISILDRGFVFAIGHVRGGGELGEAWRDAGRLRRKRTTFTDFVACAEELCSAGYTSPGRLVAHGGSAGGLLVGAVLNMRPELFAGAVAEVPFVDVLNTMLDPSLPLTAVEWEEWGDPLRSEEDHRYIASYSPYDNVDAKPYPRLLVTAGLNDPRVHYWEPAKWVARLRDRGLGTERVLLRTRLESGHGGPSGRYDAIRERHAFIQAFVFDLFGIRD